MGSKVTGYEHNKKTSSPIASLFSSSSKKEREAQLISWSFQQVQNIRASKEHREQQDPAAFHSSPLTGHRTCQQVIPVYPLKLISRYHLMSFLR